MSDAKPYTTMEFHTGYDPDRDSSILRVEATVRALDAARAEVTALRARVAELEAKVERQKASLAEHMKKTPIQTALEVAVPALEAERDEWKAKATESAALAERLREELVTIQRIAQGDRAPDDALDLALVATRRALGP